MNKKRLLDTFMELVKVGSESGKEKEFQGFLKKKFWTKKMLKDMVGKKITEKEYEIITGEKYE